jgi:hypothetical protein
VIARLGEARELAAAHDRQGPWHVPDGNLVALRRHG